MKNDAFAGFHPLVNFFYFAAVIGFAMFFTHPILLAISFFCASAYALYLSGKKIIRAMKFILPLLFFAAILNPLFNHQGATILFYLPSGNPLTLESTLYGAAAAVMLVTVIAWFSCFNAVITSDKFIYLFGRIAPATSLILSMSLRMVPRFRSQIKIISDAQKGIGRDASQGNIFSRVENGIKIFSVLVTWALENSIETADSMKSRGYGLSGRTAFSIFRFCRRDFFAALYIFVCVFVVIAGAAAGEIHFRYFPAMRFQTGGVAKIIFAVYFALGIFPLILNLKEDLNWKRIESKI
jgi:energy-coupling factor transport system permease protein